MLKRMIFAAVGGGLLVAILASMIMFFTSYNFPSAQNQRGEFVFEQGTPPARWNLPGNVRYLWQMLRNPESVGDMAAGGSWDFRAISAAGQASRTLRLSADELAALRVDSTNANGDVTLTISQGDITRTINISSGFDGSIDTSEFVPGRLRLTLGFANALDVNTAIRWR